MRSALLVLCRVSMGAVGTLERRRGPSGLMRALLTLAVVALAVGGMAPPEARASAGKMYWADCSPGTMHRANLDGTGVEDLFAVTPCPYGIALDAAGGKMYWTDYPSLKILRANLDGSGVEDVVTGSVSAGIALDVAGGKMYWSEWIDCCSSKIRRANLDGTGAEDLVTGLESPAGIALDVAGGKIYWTDYGYRSQKIQRANLDGTGVEDLVTGLVYPVGIALDPTGGKMYWTDTHGSGKIQRANLDGTSVEDLIVDEFTVFPAGIALDPARGKMYWTNYASGKIRRASLDGTGVEDLVTQEYSMVIALHLGTEVGGSMAGLSPGKVVCRNLTTGQKAKIAPAAESWDCTAAGLVVNPGDQVKMVASGSALDQPIGGSAFGLLPLGKVVCRNLTSGQKVKIVPPPGAQSWDCSAASLVANPGDAVKMAVSGSAP